MQTIIERWRPHVVVRESAELASLAAADGAGVPHVHVCIGMHEVLTRFAGAVAEPLDELGRLAGCPDGDLVRALAAEPVFSLVPQLLDHAPGREPPEGMILSRFHEPAVRTGTDPLPAWGEPEHPLVYVTFGSVAGSIPHFAGVFREALDALADLDARVLMTVGRAVDPEGLGPIPANALVRQWLPQADVLAQAAAMLGHGGFGTTMGALAAGVPQAVAPLFAFDQVVNGEHVAAVGAGVTTRIGPGGVARAASRVRDLLTDPRYAASARRVATAMRELPPPSAAVPILTGLVQPPGAV